jgi:2,3-bisphosphoglycerate-dependent phosphoglycerate mutase
MQLYFIRHGQSANNLLYATTGSDQGRDCDPELTKSGRQQAELLAGYLHQERFNLTHLYTSMMVRAVSTGMIVANRLALPLVAWLDIHEEGGIYLSDQQRNPVGQPGKDRVYYEKHFPELILPDTMNPAGWWNRPYELSTERPIRAQRFLKELLSRHAGTDHQVAVFSHGGFYNHVLSVMLDMPARQPIWFLLNNTAISRFDFYPDKIDFAYHNRIDHLNPDLIT